MRTPRTNKHFNYICASFLYREFSFLSSLPVFWVENLRKYTLGLHWNHVTVLRLCVDYSSMKVPYRRLAFTYVTATNCDPNSLAVLSECKNIRSLGLYYSRMDADFTPFAKRVIDMLENNQLKRLTAIGIYSKQIVNISRRRITIRNHGPATFLQALIASEKASSAVEVLDVAVEDFSCELYSYIQSGFTNLKSLSLREASIVNEIGTGPILAKDIQNLHPSKFNLTKIQLIECKNLDIVGLLTLIRHFRSIQDLSITKCYGELRDSEPRGCGWSSLPYALCRTRTPLQSLRIEHMDGKAIEALGVIPVVCLTLVSKNALEVFVQDPEIFPMLEVMHILPDKTEGRLPAPDDNGKGYNVAIVDFCESRNIELKTDAERITICNPWCHCM